MNSNVSFSDYDAATNHLCNNQKIFYEESEDVETRKTYSSVVEILNTLLDYDNTRKTRVLNNPLNIIISKLNDVAKNCSFYNWDYQGAEPVNNIIVKNTIELLNSINESINIDEDILKFADIDVEPDGHVALVWEINGFIVSLGMDDKKHIAYGAKTPKGIIRGDIDFDGTISGDIIKLFELILKK